MSLNRGVAEDVGDAVAHFKSIHAPVRNVAEEIDQQARPFAAQTVQLIRRHVGLIGQLVQDFPLVHAPRIFLAGLVAVEHVHQQQAQEISVAGVLPRNGNERPGFFFLNQFARLS